MLDEPFLPPLPRLMNPAKARNIGRMHKALAETYEAAGEPRRAATAMQESGWWLTYSLVLATTNERDE